MVVRSGRKRSVWAFGALPAITALVLATLATTGPVASAASNPLKGKTVKLIIPFSPGGGFDMTARLTVPYLEKYTGATVVPENVTGGGGMVGENTLYASPANGLTIGEVGPDAAVINSVTATPGVTYQPQKFVWLAGATASSTVLLETTKAPYTSLKQLESATTGITVGATGAGDNDFYAGVVMFKGIGMSAQWVTGYSGSSQLVDGLASGKPAAILVGGDTAYEAIKNGFGRPLLQINLNNHPELAHTPTILQVVPKTSRWYKDAVAISDVETADRAFAAPPGLSPAMAAAWRAAFQQTFSNPQFLQQMQKAGLTASYHSGQIMQTRIGHAMQEAKVLVPLLKAANASLGS